MAKILITNGFDLAARVERDLMDARKHKEAMLDLVNIDSATEHSWGRAMDIRWLGEPPSCRTRRYMQFLVMADERGRATPEQLHGAALAWAREMFGAGSPRIAAAQVAVVTHAGEAVLHTHVVVNNRELSSGESLGLGFMGKAKWDRITARFNQILRERIESAGGREGDAR